MIQASLFGIETLATPEAAYEDVVSGSLPTGTRLVLNFVSKREEQAILAELESATWSNELKRRVQHYGYRYDYTSRKIDAANRIGPLPAWMRSLAERLSECEYFEAPPDQVIANEYLPGQGISPHVDRSDCFGPVVASLSLNSPAVMDFVGPNDEHASILLPPRSLLALDGEARYHWTHGIASRKRDVIDGSVYDRTRRVSLTFRSILER